MKLIGIATSPRKIQTTHFSLQESLKAAKEENPEIETELIELAEKKIGSCVDCGSCRKELTCSIKDDFYDLIPVLADKDLKALIIATPVYMGSMSSQCKAFLDRTVSFRRNNFLFRNLIGGVIAVGGARSGGQELSIQAVHAAFLIHDMIIAGDGKPSAHFGGSLWAKGKLEVIKQDEVGLDTARNLGRRIAGLMSKL